MSTFLKKRSNRLAVLLLLACISHLSSQQYCDATDATIDWTNDQTIWCNCGKASCTSKQQCLTGSDPDTDSQGFEFVEDKYEYSVETCMAYNTTLHTNYAKSTLLEKCPGEDCASCTTLPGTNTSICTTCPVGATSTTIFTISIIFIYNKICN